MPFNVHKVLKQRPNVRDKQEITAADVGQDFYVFQTAISLRLGIFVEIPSTVQLQRVIAPSPMGH